MSSAAEMRDLAAILTKAATAAKRRAVTATQRAAIDIGKAYQAKARVDTGAMVSSVTVEGDLGGLRQIVGPTEHYAFFQEYGTSTITGDHVLQNVTDEGAKKWVERMQEIGDELL